VTGARVVNSGFPTGPRSALVATFPKVGTFQYFCLVHPLMRGEVRVLPKTATPGHARDAARARRERAGDVAAGRSAITKANAAGGTQILVGVGTRRWSVLQFLPRNLTVKAGVPVTFRSAGRNEVHTVTFGPKAYLDALEKAFETAQSSFPPEAAYSSDPPGGAPLPVALTSHGNGFVNSGLMGDASPGAPQPTFTVVFPSAGTYQYRCLVHGTGMSGVITVTP
jgi:plastocyanin